MEHANRFTRGWVLVLATAYCLSIGSGLGFYAQSIYLAEIVRVHNLPVSGTSLGSTFFLLISGLTGIVIGQLMRHIDIRWIIGVGALTMGFAIVLLGYVESLMGIYGFYAVLGVGFACVGTLPATTLITRWFVKRRAFALAVSQSGLSLGGIVITPILAERLSLDGLTGGQAPFFVALILLVFPIILLCIRNDPRDIGIGPDGGEPLVAPADTRDATPLGNIARQPFFVLLTAASALALFTQVGAIAHAYSWALERADFETATRTLAVLAFFSFISRLIWGNWLDRISILPFTVGLYLCQALSMMLMSFATGNFAVLAVTTLFGCTVGLILMVQPLIIASHFRTELFSSLLSINQFVMTCCVGLGPLVVGLCHDYLGGYNFGFLVLSTSGACAALCLHLARAYRPVLATC